MVSKSRAARKKKRGGGGEPKVLETTRIIIRETLERLLASAASSYTFEQEFNNAERGFVHELSRKMGMFSRSSGKKKQRRVTVSKDKKNSEPDEGQASLPSVGFSKEAREVLEDVFTRYPPDENGGSLTVESMVEGEAQVPSHLPSRPDELFEKPALKKEEIACKMESLASMINSEPKLKEMAKTKSRLPISSFRDEITSTVKSHQVVLISGETGCGKTTQVPQYLLDYMWGMGESCKIVCTQPRRISAISVAERIASERGEQIGDSVGYKIRLESIGGRHSSIVFCTNGVLLRVLVNKGFKVGQRKRTKGQRFPTITHIIVDEIHERDRYSDLILAILRDLLPEHPNLRLILMSATLDAERFSQYFDGCPIICVPGFTHPVKSFYLEDVLSLLKPDGNTHADGGGEQSMSLTEEDKAFLDEALSSAWLNDEFDSLLELVSGEVTQKVYNYQHSSSGISPLMVFASKGRVEDLCTFLSLGADCQLRANDGANALDLAERENQKETAELLKRHMESNPSSSQIEQALLDKYLGEINPELIDVALIEKLLMKICSDLEDGAILVFLPGWDDIKKTRDRLRANPFFNNSSKFEIFSLHSMIPSIEQKKVFNRLPSGCRKIILSTNIAETSVTIDDVVYVIDSGRQKEKSYDPYNNVSTLQSSWVSKASTKQREGRAGRCQPGICYHLFSKLRAASFPEFQVPEIRRMPVEELCLQVKLINQDCRIVDFLQKTMDPPLPETIRNGIIILQDIGALSTEENITELGKRLGSLPVHPVTSKMLFFAILMNCLDPALTIACAADYRDPFNLPMLPSERIKANAARAEFASLYGHSDQLAVVAAFECWRNAREKGDEKYFCDKYFISSTTMKMLSGMRNQLQNELIRSELIPKNVSQCSLNARDPGILHAVLLSSLYPMVGRLLPPIRPGRPIVIDTASNNKVRLHPASVNSKLPLKKNDSPLIMYDEVTRGDWGMHIRNCTTVGPLPLLFLSTEISVAPAQDGHDDSDIESGSDSGDGELDDNVTSGQKTEKFMSMPENSVVAVVDRWLYFQSTALDVAQIYLLKERLSAAINFKVKYPREVLPPILGASVYAIACILSYDGLSGALVTPGPVDSLTSMVNATEISKSASRATSQPRPRTTDKYLGGLFCDSEPRKVSHSQHYHHNNHFNRANNFRGTSYSRDTPGPSGPHVARNNNNNNNNSSGGHDSVGNSHKRLRSNGAG